MTLKARIEKLEEAIRNRANSGEKCAVLIVQADENSDAVRAAYIARHPKTEVIVTLPANGHEHPMMLCKAAS